MTTQASPGTPWISPDERPEKSYFIIVATEKDVLNHALTKITTLVDQSPF